MTQGKRIDNSVNITGEQIKFLLAPDVSFVFANTCTVQKSDANFYVTFGLLDPTLALGEGTYLNAQSNSAELARVTGRIVMPVRVGEQLLERLVAGLHAEDPVGTLAMWEALGQFMQGNKDVEK